MKPPFKVIEANRKAGTDRGPYREIALYVRELLQCDYALVAVPEKDSIRIQGFVGGGDETFGAPVADVLSRLGDWGPVVVDDARLIAVPVSRGNDVKGVLIGYSAKPGTFKAEDLNKLMAYTHVALGILDSVADQNRETQTSLSADELQHFTRLMTIGELSSCFAHEVNNPLTLIRGHVRFIEETLTSDHPLRANFEAIDRASKRIQEIAKRMLDFSRKRTAVIELCDVAELVADALRFIQPYFRTGVSDVQVHIEPHLPKIRADRSQLVQAIVNLLQNAADSMAGVDRRVLSIMAYVEGTEVRIAVSDTGLGIAPDNLSKIFQPFFTTKGERGTGLGLYITKQLVEENNGTIDVQTSHRGTSFVISLPL